MNTFQVTYIFDAIEPILAWTEGCQGLNPLPSVHVSVEASTRHCGSLNAMPFIWWSLHHPSIILDDDSPSPLGSRKDFQKGSSSFQQMLEWRCLLVLQRVLVWRCGYEYESKKTHFTCCAMSNLGDSFKIQSILSCAWKTPMVGGFKHLDDFSIYWEE